MLLTVRGLRAAFFLEEGVIRPVDGVSFDVAAGETVGLVGESGCGKSVVALSLIDLVPPPGRILSGTVSLDGRDVLGLDPPALREVRGAGIGMVFQDPSASLNPVHRVGDQIADVLRLHRRMDRTSARAEAIRLLGDVGIAEPEKRARSYPFELSGGMRQRVMIAIAVAGRPKLLVADEPTTALDPTVQADICDLLRWVQGEFGMAILLISHDLRMVAEMADRIMVMYAGRLVEVAHAAILASGPLHPYSRGLVGAIPTLGAGREAPLRGIPGAVPDLLDLPQGCSFRPRCPDGDEECAVDAPALRDVGDRRCACFKVEPRS